MTDTHFSATLFFAAASFCTCHRLLVSTPDSIQPRKEPVQERSRERFERILEVALELIVTKGVDAVAMSEIASNSQISIASLYQYFPDKAAIVATLADRFNQEGRRCVEEAFAHVQAPTDMITALHEMIDGYLEFFTETPGPRAIWQATQADLRLHFIDEEDCEAHSSIISRALQRVSPKVAPDEAFRLGRVLTCTVAMVVRNATTQDLAEAKACVDLCKEQVLRPCMKEVLGL